MRVRGEQSLDVPSGWLMIGDAEAVPCHPSTSAVGFSGTTKPMYRIYGRDGLYVVDTAPRVFRANRRTEFKPVGEIRLKGQALAVCDANESFVRAAQDALGQGRALLVPASDEHYRIWIESKDESSAVERAILAIGPKVTLLLSGPDADEIRGLEQSLARVLRLKGPDKQAGLRVLREAVLGLHRRGCRDARLRLLASTLDVNLWAEGRRTRQ
jgi:hypothetical protein